MKLDRRKSSAAGGRKNALTLLAVAICVRTSGAVYLECDKIFKLDAQSGPLNGSFESPAFGDGNYAQDLQCIYTFIAMPGFRVKLTFQEFLLTGTATSCDGDYMDIYSDLPNPHVDLMEQELSGRYCGSVSPPVRISLHFTTVIIFHTRSDSKGAKGFKGTYSFFKEDEYIVGTPSSGSCGFTINQYKKKKGVIMTPTYPGAYPANFECTYRFIGQKGQRIRMYFQDFDLYFGGEHCPYDALTIHDGDSAGSPIMRKVCGIQQKLVLFSFGESLFLVFRSSNPPNSHHRGFRIRFAFSAHFVDVEKLIGSQSGVSHLRGTECDLRVQSNRETTHVITSPNYPHQYPGNTTCTYILDGLQGVQDLEKVVLNFHAFSVASKVGDLRGAADSSGECEEESLDLYLSSAKTPTHSLCGTLGSGLGVAPGSRDPLGGPYESDGPRLRLKFQGPGRFKANVAFQTGSCVDGRVAVYETGQDWRSEAADAEFCTSGGGDALPPVVSSHGPRLVLVFASAPDLRDSGFKAVVQFQTDFGIEGTPVGNAENKCQFRFDAETGTEGFFNSPRYPSNYPVDTTCIYYLNAGPNRLVRVYFEQFALDRGLSKADECGDWVALWDVWPDGRERQMATYCAHQFPGPIVSSFGASTIRVEFKSDVAGTMTGFKALFDFIPAPVAEIPAPGAGCGGVVESAGGGGWVASPGYPNRYVKNLVCNWEIRVPPGRRVLLQPIEQDIEGTMGADVDCRQAAIRVYLEPGKTFSQEFCGTDKKLIKDFISNSSTLRLSFLTSPDKVNGLTGFNFSWTAVIHSGLAASCADHGQFRCINSKYCIHERLRCNGAPNCGHNDNTDEGHCDVEETSDNQGLILGGAAGGLVLVLVATLACLLLRRRTRAGRRRRPAPRTATLHGHGLRI